MYTQNYTRLATIRPVVLSTSTSRYGRCDFPQGRQTGLTLVLSNCQYLFKVANKDVLFTAQNNPDGTVTLQNPAGFLSLTVAGTEVIRLCDKAGISVDEPFMTLDEHLAFHYDPADEPTCNTFTVPILTDIDDLADFANSHLGSYFGKHQPSIISRKLPNGKWQRRGGRTPRPTRKKPASRRISRKGPAPKRTMPTTYTPTQYQADVSLLWG